jgi:phenylpropionate dioxygenase-like ring-hydroxylating dioxygenase large terminal subunit
VIVADTDVLTRSNRAATIGIMTYSSWTPSLVTDAAVWDVEQRTVFADNWIAVARSSDLRDPGTYLSARIADEPVVVVRDKDHRLRAISNVCRHRGTTLVEGFGSARSLQCPNHRWTYGLDGSLVAAPSMDGVADFEMVDHCLPVFAVCEWQGWIMVNLSATAPPLHESVQRLDSMLADVGLASMERVGSLSFPSPWNWKISVENFAESYHHQSVHPQTLQPIYPGARSFVIDSKGEPWSWLDHESTEPSLDPFTATVLFPTLLFSLIRPDAMAWFHLDPVSLDRTNLSIEVFVEPTLVDNQPLIDGLLDSLRQINSEDIDINRRTFEGLQSRYAAMGPLSTLEGAVAQFRSWMLDQLRSDCS